MFSRLIKIARQLRKVPTRGTQHFTFILRRGHIYSIGWNKCRKTHPLAKKYEHRFSCVHSELDALLNYLPHYNTLSKCVVVNIRILADGSIGMSRPCQPCRELLRDYGIQEVYYSLAGGNFGLDKL